MERYFGSGRKIIRILKRYFYILFTLATFNAAFAYGLEAFDLESSHNGQRSFDKVELDLAKYDERIERLKAAFKTKPKEPNNEEWIKDKLGPHG